MIDIPPATLYAPAIIRPAEHALLHPGAFRPMTREERRATISELIRSKRLTPADARLAMLLVPIIGWTKIPLVLTYINSAASTTDATSYDFGNFNAATAGLMIVAALGSGTTSGGSTTISTVSIGGTNGTIHVNPVTGRVPTAIASRVVSSGNNNVTVTVGSTQQECSAHVWLLTGYSSATPAATSGTNPNTTGTSVVMTLDIPAGGIAVFGATHQNNNATSWSSATSRNDASSGASRFSSADKSTVGALTAHAETASWTGSNHRGGSAASWS